MITTILFYSFTLVNLLVVRNVYWPLMKDHVDAFIALNTITKSWQTSILCVILFLKIILSKLYHEKVTKLKQWWHETAIPIDDDRFLLVHYIQGEKVHLMVKKRPDKIVAVVDEGYDECFLDEAKPFLLYEQEELSPEMLGLKKTIIVHTEEGKREIKAKDE